MLSKICSSLEVSRKLKELGIEMETKFYWESDLYNQDDSVGCWFEEPQDVACYYEYTPCFTLEQVLEMLPDHINCHPIEMSQNDFYYQKGCSCDYDPTFLHSKLPNENLVTTACRLLIKLREDKII